MLENDGTKLKILIISQYFWPESFIITDIAQKLSDQSHEVVVATGKPNYPDGVIFDGYAVLGTQRERYLGQIEVVRVPLWPRKKGGSVSLILNYLSFVFSGVLCFPWLLRNREFDAILVFAPSPVTQAIPAILVKWLKGAHLFLWVQDLWPESLCVTGYIKNKILLKIVGWVVRGIYSCTDILLIQSEAFHAPVAKYAKADKIVYYPNSVEIYELPKNESQYLPVNLMQLLDSHFCLIFAGNIGKAQAVETLVEAALHLKNLSNCKIVLVGSGSMLEWVQERKTIDGLDNLVLAGRFPMNAMPSLYHRAAGLVVTLKDEEIFSYTIPSKVQAYLAAGKPIIAALNGEGARVVLESGAGLACPAEDAKALSQCVRTLYAMPENERAQMGNAGRAYFLEHFEMNRQAKRLVEIFEQRIAHSGGKT